MQRIFSYNLAILFYLLQDKTLRIPITNRVTKEALDSSFDSLESTINGSDTPQDMLFCRNIQNNDYIVSVEEPQKLILKDYLQKYCKELMNDHLYTEELLTYEWKHERQKFIKNLVEAHYNLNCYHVSNVYELYLIVPELLRFDYKINIEIDTRFIPQHSRGSCHELFYRENFKFNCTLNLSSIVEKQEEVKPHTEETEPKSFSTQQQKYMYSFFEDKAKSGKFSFFQHELIKAFFYNNTSTKKKKVNALNSAINRLNKQYQMIYDTENYLIKYDRGENMYILKNIWNYNDFG